MKKTIAFLYRWTEKSTGMWYEGSRSANGCYPEDGYVCSSEDVKPMILECPANWSREILVMGEPGYIRKLETARLVSLDAKNDPMSYNKSNAMWDPGNRLGRKESDITRKRKSDARKGDKNPMYGLTGELCPHYNKTHNAVWKENQSIGVATYAKTRPQEHNDNISKSLKGNPNVGLKGSLNPSYGKPERSAHLNGTTHYCKHCCRTIAGKGNYARYHGNRCKHNTEVDHA